MKIYLFLKCFNFKIGIKSSFKFVYQVKRFLADFYRQWIAWNIIRMLPLEDI